MSKIVINCCTEKLKPETLRALGALMVCLGRKKEYEKARLAVKARDGAKSSPQDRIDWLVKNDRLTCLYPIRASFYAMQQAGLYSKSTVFCDIETGLKKALILSGKKLREAKR